MCHELDSALVDNKTLSITKKNQEEPSDKQRGEREPNEIISTEWSDDLSTPACAACLLTTVCMRERSLGAYCPTWVRIAGNALRLDPASFSQSRQVTSFQDVAVLEGD
jgi:hypothetical protein